MADLRLADLLASLSQATDLGMGQPPDTAVRTCLLATGLARRMSLAESAVSDIYYTALLQHIGCTAYAHETAALLGGDDILIRGAGSTVDFGNPKEAFPFLLTVVGKGAPAVTRARAVTNALRMGSSFDEALARSNCEAALNIAARLGLGAGVQEGLLHIYERWDGRGQPRKLAGDNLSLPARFVHLASQTEIFHRLGGSDLVIATVRQRAGGWLDPALVALFQRDGPELLAEIDNVDVALAVLEAEPVPRHSIDESAIDTICRAFADMTDLKSPYFSGHSPGVARLAEEAAHRLGLSAGAVAKLRRAALLHDLGRVGVANGIWDRPGPLTSTEWEQVRLHSYHSERILTRTPALASLALLAGMHHERLDGTGYHRQTKVDAIPIEARLLAASDVYQAMTQRRPHRLPLTPDAAAVELQDEANRGRLDPDAVSAVLAAAGHHVSRARASWPAGLTSREVDVLRLAAQGMSKREISTRLSISPKTVDHHIQHIYTKIGVSTRAGAAIFAMQHDLIQPSTLDEMG